MIGEDFLEFPNVPRTIAGETQLVHYQRYVGGHVVCATYFQVFGGKLHVSSFGAHGLGASHY